MDDRQSHSESTTAVSEPRAGVLNLAVVGDEVPVLLLHHALGCFDAYSNAERGNLAEWLTARGCQVVGFDLEGHGDSAPVRAALDALRGWSLGAALFLRYSWRRILMQGRSRERRADSPLEAGDAALEIAVQHDHLHLEIKEGARDVDPLEEARVPRGERGGERFHRS